MIRGGRAKKKKKSIWLAFAMRQMLIKEAVGPSFLRLRWENFSFCDGKGGGACVKLANNTHCEGELLEAVSSDTRG